MIGKGEIIMSNLEELIISYFLQLTEGNKALIVERSKDLLSEQESSAFVPRSSDGELQ